jgi:starch phosphorylase
MPTLRRFTVIPRLPASIEKLRALAHNLWWAWSPEARELFTRIDADLWDEVHGNPIELLSRVPQARLDELGTDDAFVAHLEASHAALEKYLSREGWFRKTFPEANGAKIAYFSMEYGLHESLPIYSGGLGVLAGDHLKTASDLGLPLVGIGLAYAEGYFRQVLADDGLQGERYPINDWHRLPVQPVFDGTGKRLIVHVAYPDRAVDVQLWRVQVGRVPLYLLDANLEQNTPADRAITGPLYGGDQEFRVRQEIMLGIGGMYALESIGITPTVCHMNEGHSAFLGLERISRLMRSKGVSFAVATEACSAGNVFTTHTPVPAGNDVFAPELVTKYLEPYRAALKLNEQQLLDLGRAAPLASGGTDKRFSMPVFAIHTADNYNGVSALHGEVSRKMYNDLWPELPEHEVPIGSITNGVHIPSWVSDEMGALFTRYLGPRWAESTHDRALWARVQDIPDAELWQIHTHRRQRLVTLARQWLRASGERRGASRAEIDMADEVLDPQALTIGFARRFATYKRSTLLFSDVERVMKILGNADRPVQLVFAGKAHPQDKPGKELIRSIVRASRDAGLRGKVIFIEDYDMRIARAMVAGVDVWLNTPRRPLEASGTSGMKAAANGALNLSILDGWWAEAWRDYGWQVGWAIGRGEEYQSDAGDKLEAEALYDLLEREVVPLFFDRESRDGMPRGWVKRMKNAIAKLVPDYNTQRMVQQYSEKFYVPAIRTSNAMMNDGLKAAEQLVAWKEKVKAAWPQVAIASVAPVSKTELAVGEKMTVEAIVKLGSLKPEDVAVELYYGPTLGGQELPTGSIVRMALDTTAGAATAATDALRFVGSIPTSESGAHAFAARVIPFNAAMSHPYETTLIRWA